MFSGKRGAALLAVIILHVIVGYAFYSGLAQRLVSTVIPPVEIAQIDKPKDIDKPPPPPPKLEEIKPYVPPPEFVDIQAPQVETTAITQVTQTVQAPPPPVAQVAAVAPPPKPGTPPRVDPKHPINVDDYYPDSSRRAGEFGRCVAKVTIGTDGHISTAEIAEGTSFPRLDEACLKVAKLIRMIPATAEGKPIETVTNLPIVFKFKQ